MRRLAFFIGLLFASAAQAQCPSNYVLVPNESTYKIGNVCVAKYEMKNVGGVATSQASGTPWVSVTISAARSACAALGPTYHLITNSERMTIARKIEATASNWSTGIVNSGEINQGHSDVGPNSALAANVDDNQACEGTSQTCSSTVWDSQRRTHNIDNSVLWDFSGNVLEWVDWVIVNTDKASPQSNWIEINASSPTEQMAKLAYWPVNETLTSTNLIGKYFPGPTATGGYVGYGGGYNYGIYNSGVFMVITNFTSATTDTNLGFRCVTSIRNLTRVHHMGDY